LVGLYLLSGNHSSGKSSFINYVCQRKVQTAGVAPTDDGFTIIVPGPSDVDRDGNITLLSARVTKKISKLTT
jgi:hypothetical protein